MCCVRREDDAVLRLTEDAAFKRRLMAETGTFTAAGVEKACSMSQCCFRFHLQLHAQTAL